ncbi:hypothetical protein OPT61_g10519 [Boeremia exigua]|uniref:Uncharacterized protein n=1 Tax=Boeremia exigua TaxID=749465 RepID=A0ACC2HPH8_9PLEO|nr:hypothetical protein OPT61_g10519 [Boeremia exigua]
MNTIHLARAGGCSIRILSCALADIEQGSTAPDNDNSGRRESLKSQAATQSVEPSAANVSSNEEKKTDDSATMMANNQMMNGMQNQMGFGFQGQGNFGGMGFNGMSNTMSNAGWNNMNSMDYNMNNMNGMYNNFGGNMGMAMNDMSAMNMMNFGGGYGNGWNGMGGGYGNFNAFNQIGGYNQSGAYPEMMNQFPKNNFQAQNQNRFPADQGGVLLQQNNKAGSQRGSISGPAGSRSEATQNVRFSHKSLAGRPVMAPEPLKSATDSVGKQQRDGESPDASTGAAADSKPEGEQDTTVKPTEEGKDHDGSAAPATNPATNSTEVAKDSTATGDQGDSVQSNGLNQIQTVESEDGGMQSHDQSMMGNGMQPGMGFANGMMNQFPNQMQMNAPFDPSMNMGFHQNSNFGPRGGFNAAYGAATVLTGEPQGRGVEGAPTGPRAMREGRPNTGFSSRMNNARHQPPPKSVTPAQSTGARSPQRRVRSRSPLRDENLRTRDKSASRSRSRSRGREVEKDMEKGDVQERLRSTGRGSGREGRARSVTPQRNDDYERRKDHRNHRSSRHDDRENEYEERHRDERGSRGDRTRSASVDSKYRSSRRDKEKHRSSRSQRDRSKEHRRRYRSRSPAEESSTAIGHAKGTVSETDETGRIESKTTIKSAKKTGRETKTGSAGVDATGRWRRKNATMTMTGIAHLDGVPKWWRR